MFNKDYMKHFLQTLVIEIAEVHLKTTFPTPLPRALGPVYWITSQFMARCDNREDHSTDPSCDDP